MGGRVEEGRECSVYRRIHIAMTTFRSFLYLFIFFFCTSLNEDEDEGENKKFIK